MAQDEVNGPSSPGTGRWVVLIAGGVGIAAIVGYGVLNNRDRADVSAALAQRHGDPAQRSEANLELLLARAHEARDALDVGALVELADSLQGLAKRTRAPERLTIELELADVLAARALEASIRAHTVQADRGEAQRIANDTIAAITPILDGLEVTGADPGRLHAVRARVALAAGTDVLEQYPAVMLPTFRDEELRLATMAGPVWREPDATSEMVSEVVAALRDAQRDTGLVQALLAIALAAEGDDEAALAVLDAMLKRVPSQPMARAFRAELMASPSGRIAAAVGVSASSQTTDEDTPRSAGAVPPEEPDEPTPPAELEPPKEPEPPKERPESAAQPEPQPPPKPKAEKQPSNSTQADPPKKPSSKADPSKKPEPKPANTGTSRANDFDALQSEGCKKVQSGEAAAGFELLAKAFDLQPGSVPVIVCMAQAHHQLGRTASARAMAERALGKAPKNKGALTLMATLEAERGNRPGAEKYYRKLLELDPNHAKAKAYLGE
jgi:tetratricopeptide (TPR) repeat protein